MARGKSDGLGFGKGSIIEYDGGIIEYRPTGKSLPAFKVNIADVTGFLKDEAGIVHAPGTGAQRLLLLALKLAF
jgi:hypothetical protein